MKVPLLDLGAQFATIGDQIKKEVEEVLESTRYIMGPKVTGLEEEVAKYSEADFGIGVSSGTDALLVSLMALDIGPGDLVITSTYSFFATAGVIARVGATPVFLDIDPQSFNLDPQALKGWVAEHPTESKQVKAIIPVHLYGQCADMDAILEVANELGAAVVEDAAQAIGARYPSKQGVKRAGSIGTIGCFSFFPSKNLGGVGDGGMVVTNDPQLAEKLRLMRNHGAKPKYYHSMIGGNFRLDPIQAAVLSVKLKHLDAWHAARQKNAAYYDQRFSAAAIKKPTVIYEREYHIYNQYVISVPDRREELRAFLNENNVGHEVYYPVSFHEQECFSDLGYKLGDFPHSEDAARHTVALPIYPELPDEMQDYVVEKIEEFYS